MTIPAWAYEEISRILPDIRASGEKQTREFMAEFPAQGHDLAKEVAAFATSGGGLILIGVRDDGCVAGLDEGERDKLRLRAQGIVSQVKPCPKVDVTLCYDEGFILSILIRQDQTEPVYYYDHRPYIRDGSQSRPATPEEVNAKVWSHPSSEHKKRMEDLKYEQARTAAELANKRTTVWDELAVKSAADHHALMSRARESFQRTNEMTRQAFIPKQ
jgi:predicted HTH transcriptional regulator